MRRRLRAAVHALLADGSLTGAQDAVRCAAVVLMAKTNAADLDVSRLTAEEMGRWLGVSGSTVSHVVRPGLHRGLARTRDNTPKGESRWVRGIDWQLFPLVRARREGAAGDPLRLVKADFATLLKFTEALIAPGWTDTPPGLLARRTGHHAATDRLALLLLALEARADGRVRLCGGATGAVDRTVATLARLGSWSAEEAGRILDRLAGEGVVTVSGGRITVPAVAASHGLIARQARAAGRPMLPAPRPEEAPEEAPETAWRDQIVIPSEFMQVSPYKTAVDDPCTFAGPHALHAPVAHLCSSTDPSMCFSGEGAMGVPRLPERAREEGTPPGDTDGPANTPADDAAQRGPLRGDKQDLPTTHDDDQEQEQPETGEDHGADGHQEREERPAGGTATDGPETTGKAAEGAPVDAWRATRGGRAPEDIADLVNAAPGLWEALGTPGRQRLAARWIRTELRKIDSGLIEFNGDWDQPDARTILTRRIARRCAQSAGGATGARDVVAWLRGVVLPQRGCGENSCDDGVDMNHDTPCQRCDDRVEDGRRMRQRAWTETVGELRPGATATPEQLAAYDQRLAELAHHKQASQADDARDLAARHAQEAAAWEAGRAEREAARAAAAEREAARLAQPCADCGAPGAAGLCGTCREDRRTEELLDTAMRAYTAASRLVDPGACPEDLARITAATRQRMEDDLAAATEPLRAAGLTGPALAASRRLTAQRLGEEMQSAMVTSVAATDAVDEESRRASYTATRRGHLSLLTPAEAARHRVAEVVLDRAMAAEPEEAWTCAADGCESEPVTAAGLCGRHLVARSATARRSAAPRPAVAEDDLCADGCGRPALLIGPYCGRCHIDHVQEREAAAVAVAGGAR